MPMSRPCLLLLACLAPVLAGTARAEVVVRGRVLDGDDRPVAGATVGGTMLVTAGPGGHAIGGGPIPERTTAADGTFTVELTDAAERVTVRLRARHRGAFTAGATELRGEALGKPAVLKVSPKNARALSVRVVDEDGKPVAAAAVTARHRTGRLPPLPWGPPRPVDRTGKETWACDREGRFESPPCLDPDGGYQLELSADGFLAEKTAWKEAGGAKVVAFGDVTLRRLHPVEGQVVDRRGKPVAGARVWLADRRQRVEGTTDAEGRFRLRGALLPTGCLFVQKDGFRFHGRRWERPGPVKIALVRRDEAGPKGMATLAPALPRAERKELATGLLEPLLRRVLDRGDDDRLRPLQALARVDAGRLLAELERRPYGSDWYDSYLRRAAAGGLLAEAPEEARAVVDSMKDAGFRSTGYLDLCDALPAGKRAEKLALLNQALLHARGIEKGDHRVIQLGGVARRLWGLGEKAKATKLLREGEEIARELPTAWAGYARGAFAEDLALLDLPAALGLMKDLKDPHEYVRHHGNLAARIAGSDPAAAERVFGILLALKDHNQVYQRDQYAVPVCYGLAPADLARARKIAETIENPSFKARAFGAMAEALGRGRPREALALLDEAFALLEKHAASGKDSFNNYWDAASLAGLMVPAAEHIDPGLVPEFFWRAVSLRAPARPDAPEDDWHVSRQGQALGALAMVLVRYDRGLALALAEEARKYPRVEGLTRADYLVAAAIADPRRAAALVEELPEGPAKDYEREGLVGVLTAEGEAVWKAVHHALAQWHVTDEDL